MKEEPQEDPGMDGRLGRKRKTPEELAAEAAAAEEEEDSKFSSLCCCFGFLWEKKNITLLARIRVDLLLLVCNPKQATVLKISCIL